MKEKKWACVTRWTEADERSGIRRYDGDDEEWMLTHDGQIVCGVAALVEELLVILVFGLRVSTCLIPVFAFLWLLFAILTSGILIGVAEIADFRNRRKRRPGQKEPVYLVYGFQRGKNAS